MFGEGLPFTRHSDVLNAKPVDDESRLRLVAELRRRGNSAFQKKLFDEAEVLYSSAIENNMNNSQNDQHIFYGNRSASRCSMGKFSEALSDADRCVQLAPDWAKGYFRQAQALTKLGRHNEALEKLGSAKRLDPYNKSVATLYDQVKQYSVIEVPEKKNFKSATKKVTRVEISTVEDASSKFDSKPNAAVLENEETALGNVRGYKKLADGRMTTYFNNELNEETKQLIGDITPKRVEDLAAVQVC
jgi:tetratricopeptide (TPR) repeat protein